MVKFKFPGKPSKMVQRSLVSAYSVVVPTCDTSSVSEDLCFGLSLFQSTFGDDDDGDDFTGFTNEDIDEAKLKKRTHENRLREKMISRGLRIPIIPLTRVVLEDNSSQNTSCQPIHSVVKKSVKECISKKKERKKSSKLWLLNKRILNRYHPKIQIRHNFKALSKNSLMRFKHKSLSANYLSDRYCRKFILPTRSLHSSRVIKPNKRFIDLDKNSKFKPKDNQHSREYENSYDGDYASNSSSSEHEKKRAKIETPSSKVIIREARLNITTETTITGPFSAKKFVSVDKESRSGVITCGICGSVRFYKYVLQTRKFGIYSCEPCRRFILKMIKYSKLPNFEVLKCKADDGVGNCVILPVTSSRRKDSNEDLFAKNSRCDACLLSLCLQKYIMPTSTKKSLYQLIPEDVKSNYLNELSPDFKKSLPALDHPLGGLSKPVSNEETHDKLRKRLNMHNYLKNVRCSKRALDKYDIGVTKSKAFLHKRNNLHQRMSLRNKFIQDNPRKETYPEKDHYVPRGPRIKHVCRSASSVLKTPSNDKEFEEPVCNLSESDCVKNSRKNSETKISEKSSQMTKIRQCDDSFPNPADSSSDDSVAKLNAQHYGARTLQDFGKESSDESDEVEDKLISTDFWEAYDPDEVYKTGFPLISSELLNVRALCFLCGSAGIEKLLYCVSCCEPYHWYCAEGPSAFREESELEKCRVNWVCRKCKVCSTCGDRDSRLLISCQRCKNSYHNECLPNKTMNKRLFKSDRPWVCPTCLKCKSCNSNSVFTYVGNIPLCSQCFKLRQNGSFCPLCQRCYQDDDYNVKMMECGICEKWIHAKCEGLSHEKYQILSFLPDTIEFVCRLCCSVPPAQWWLAVEDELKAGYLGILKCLCKNKKIGDLFKESPRKNMCRCVYKKRTASISDDSDSCIDMDSEVKTISSDSSAERCDSGVDDMKDDSTGDSRADEIQQRCSFCCYNSETRHKINNDLLSIKAKVHNNQYGSLLNFHQELQSVIEEVEELDLVQTYKDSLKKFFPWFEPDCLQNDDTQDNEVVESSTNESSPLADDSALENAIAEEENVNLKALMATDEYNYENFKTLDLRKCNLCKGTGEAIPSEGGRLIYCGRNEWVHSNCALWSSEVFEEIDGSLQNVHSAISRGRQIRCIVCDKKGASVGCCYKNCTQTYHFLCAKKANCVFLQNRTIYCHNHDTNEVTLPFLSSEKDFEILRPVYIEMDRKKKKLECHSNVKLRIGSLHVENLGKIDPHLSDNPKYILPIYFRCTRLFWSTTKPWKIIQYHIQIKLRYCYETVKSDSEVNYTVDHSTVESTEQDEKVVKQVVKEVINKVSSKDDYSFMGTQNGNDLLPPELQEAIYKDLPNDLLNDKTLQDIWNNYDTTNDSDGVEKFAKSHPRTLKLEKKKIEATSKINGLDSTRKSDENRTKINGKYLRDKNDLKEDGLRKNHSETLGNFYNELCNKVKRKINFENSTLNAKKKLFDGNYITSEKLTPIDFYQEADKGYKPPYVQSYENILQLDGMVDIHDEEPVKCDRCHRTYRTTLSFERHLEICNADFNDYMISSCESDTSSEEERFNTSTKTTPPKEPTYENVQAKYEVITIQDPKPMPNVQTYSTNVCDNLAQNTVYTFAAVQENVRTVDNQMQNNTGIFLQNLKQESMTVAPQPVVSEPLKFNLINGKIKPNVIANDYRTQYTMSNIPNTQSYQIQNMTPTYVIQSLPKPEVIPTYVAVNNTITECIQTQETLLQQPLQLQQYATVNQPSMNFQPVIPTILGTVMQPGVLETPTYYINAPAQSTELFGGQNNIILPNQPMLFGMETMVSNTVMSQSQYMTQSLTGNMGSSTMYSTTTTQVFQAAKQLPQAIPSGFIVVNSPIQQTVPVQQPVPMKQPQVVNHVPTSSTEKYMYVQINPQNVPKPEKAPKPIITKAVKNHAIPKDKPTKVMRVKNNKPVAVQAAPVNVKTYQSNYVKLNGSSKPVLNGYHTNHVNKHVTMQEPVHSTFKSVPVQSALPTVTVPPISTVKPMLPAIVRSAPKPQPVTKPFVRMDAVPKPQKVDKCVNTDRKEPPVVNHVVKQTIATNTTNERTIQISYTIDNEENLQLPDSLVKSWQVTIPVEENVVEPEPVLSTPKAESPTFEASSNDMPDLSFFEPQKTEVSKSENSEKVDIKSDSEKLFDELLRQHMLSMKSVDVVKQNIQIEEPPELKNPKIFSKNKYKPQITKKSSPTAEESKDTKTNGKRKINLEKENFNKLKNLITEAEQTKNWKTASISFEVNAEDGFTYKTNNLMDLWNKIIESVQKSRAKCKLPLLPKNAMVNADSVYSLLGFENNASKYLLEQLPDAWKCIFYKPVFHKSPMQSSKTSQTKNETGCARTEPFNSSHKYDMFGWLASRHRKPPKFMMLSDSDIVNGNRRVTSLNLPMAMRFRHLKETAKETVGVFRSDIHGRGLFCLRDIDPGEMVIEYAGEVIRSTLTDKREKYYTSKGIGCYMFRIDDKYVVDATMCGNAARFINHSCEPNCYSRIVDILGKKHILIFALRKIPKGEELTYDYKFPLEDDKIYCHCLSRKCRKYLN